MHKNKINSDSSERKYVQFKKQFDTYLWILLHIYSINILRSLWIYLWKRHTCQLFSSIWHSYFTIFLIA